MFTHGLAIRTVFVTAILLLGILRPTACYSQTVIADDSHWDPRFGPPALFANPFNIEAASDYVIASGLMFWQDESTASYGTAYRGTVDGEVRKFSIPGWEDATFMAGEARIYARRGSGNSDVAEIDLDEGDALPISSPPGPLPHRFTVYKDTLFVLVDGAVYRLDDAEWESLGSALDYEIDHWVVGPSGVFAAVGPGSICNPQDCHTDLWHLSDGDWRHIGTSQGGQNPPVSAIAADSRGRLVIAGDFTGVADVAASGAARWNGDTWLPLGEGFGPEMGFISSLAAIDTLIYAGGDRVLRWDGLAWDSVGARPSRFIRKLTTGGDRLYASGWFTAIGDEAAYRTAEWNPLENRWEAAFPVAGAGIDGEVRALATAADGSVFAGGVFSAAGNAAARNVARWDSTRWWNVGEGIGAPVSTLALGTSGLYAGTYNGIAVSDLQDASWSYMPDLPNGWELGYVQDVLIDDASLYALATAAVDSSRIEGAFRWTDGAWATIGEFWTENGFGDPKSLATDEQSVLYVAGAFTRIGDVEARNVARWDATAWHSLGDGLEHPQEVIAVGGGRVYVGGTDSDSLRIWHPDSEVWTAVPLPGEPVGGCERHITALLWQTDGLYVGVTEACVATGKNASGQESLLFRWDGDQWQILGSGIRGASLKALAGSGSDLYAAGAFFEAGSVPSYNFARWNADVRLPITVDAVPSAVRIDRNYPNPFSGSTTLRFAINRSVKRARLEIFNVLGRRVATLHDGPLAVGTHEKVFDAGSLPSGVYFCRLSADDRRWMWDMVLVR